MLAEFAAAANARAGELRTIVRPNSLAELIDGEFVGRNHTFLDLRYRTAAPGAQTAFALAISDIVQTDYLLHTLPAMALAVGILDPTNPRDSMARGVLLDGVRAQLAELVRWSPLQRPGWICTNSPCPTFDSQFNDGVWLATGRGLMAVQLTLDFLPADALDGAQREAIEAFLFREATRVQADFAARVPWYVRADRTDTNQWIVPAAGMFVVASRHADDPRWRELFAAATGYVERSLDRIGDDGDMVEGWSYAYVSAEALYLAAWYALGSPRPDIASRPFFQRFPAWLASRVQPGRYTINSGDCGMCDRVGRDNARFRQLLALAGLVDGSGVAEWARNTMFDAPSSQLSFAELLVDGRPSHPTPHPPPLSAMHRNSSIYYWRTSFADDATGLWLRGSSPSDFHAHHDYGHVSLYVRGQPILIEAGQPALYSDPRLGWYRSAAAHNSLEVRTRAGTVAPIPASESQINVLRSSAWDTEAEINMDRVFPVQIRSYRRHIALKVEPNGERTDFEASDTIFRNEEMSVAVSDGELHFRWHTGSDRPLVITNAIDSPSKVLFSIGELRIAATISAPAGCRTIPLAMPDPIATDPQRILDETLSSKYHYGFEVVCTPIVAVLNVTVALVVVSARSD